MKKIVWLSFGLLALIGVLVLSLPTLISWAGVHPAYHGPSYKLPGKRALIITTSHGVLSAPGQTEGPPTGVFASEMTHPYYTFLDGGMEVDIASITGGEVPIDPISFNFLVISPEDKRFLSDPFAQEKARYSIPVSDV
ncbi:MAG: type 1 glutamine amidotransferase domain-containing protein, partial [Halieaceae bacterium]|nr:type 1 glutamine amidotransferase domain-containing protein [Halieaceae bacterium]